MGRENEGKKQGGLPDMGPVEKLWGQIRMLHLGYTLVAAFGFAASCFLWGYVFTGLKAYSGKILIVEAVVMLIMLVSYLYKAFFVGYDDRIWRNIRNTWAVSSLLSLIGFYIARVSFIGPPETAASQGMYTLMRLITNVFAAMALSVIPALLISFIIWFLVLVIEFFGRS